MCCIKIATCIATNWLQRNVLKFNNTLHYKWQTRVFTSTHTSLMRGISAWNCVVDRQPIALHQNLERRVLTDEVLAVLHLPTLTSVHDDIQFCAHNSSEISHKKPCNFQLDVLRKSCNIIFSYS